MRTIERRFKKIQRKNEFWSDYVCLAEAVRGQKFTRRRIYTHFKKLVSPDDYNDADTNMLVKYLYKVSKTPEECTFLDKIDAEASKTSVDDTNITLQLQSPFSIAKEHILL